MVTTFATLAGWTFLDTMVNIRIIHFCLSLVASCQLALVCAERDIVAFCRASIKYFVQATGMVSGSLNKDIKSKPLLVIIHPRRAVIPTGMLWEGILEACDSTLIAANWRIVSWSFLYWWLLISLQSSLHRQIIIDLLFLQDPFAFQIMRHRRCVAALSKGVWQEP